MPWGQALQNAQAAKVDELQELHAARAIQRGWRGHKVKKVKQEEEVGSMAPSSVAWIQYITNSDMSDFLEPSIKGQSFIQDIQYVQEDVRTSIIWLTHMQCNVSLCNGDSGRPAW